MIYPYDYHCHTSFCDGKNTPEEMVKAAIEKGLKAIGFSGHSFTEFDKSYSMSIEDTKKYIDTIFLLKEKYKDKIEIYCGIEKDYFSDIESLKFDYCIGSVHYVKKGDKFIDVDLSRKDLENSVNQYYNANYLSFIEDYYDCVANLKEKTKCDIIGHFDLVTKFNNNDLLFVESDKRYQDIAFSALDKLISENVVFEVNTGAISRGYKTNPYPSEFILKRIFEKKGNVILSGDSHSADAICYKFDSILKKLEKLGFKKIAYLSQNGFKYLNL